MLKAYNYRIYPNKLQKEYLNKTFGCVRFIYNKMLSDKIEYYEKTGEMLKNTPAQYKKEYQFLKEVDSLALANAQMNLDKAYKNFFRDKSVGFPKFKSKKTNRFSYTTNNQNGTIYIENGYIKIPKLKSKIKIVLHRQFKGLIKSVTISKTPSNKYYISILVDTENIQPLKNDNKIGIDMGLDVFCTLSNGAKIKNPRFIKQYENKLAYEQRKLVRKVKGSKRYEKQRIKVAKLYEKIANCRKDFLHKISNIITNENQVIIMETLSSKEVQQNKQLSKSVSDVSWYEFSRQLKYKSNWKGKTFHKINKWFPSSQICNRCGYNDGKHGLDIREWTCPNCGTKHDRDVNASINILNKGIGELRL